MPTLQRSSTSQRVNILLLPIIVHPFRDFVFKNNLLPTTRLYTYTYKYGRGLGHFLRSGFVTHTPHACMYNVVYFIISYRDSRGLIFKFHFFFIFTATAAMTLVEFVRTARNV